MEAPYINFDKLETNSNSDTESDTTLEPISLISQPTQRIVLFDSLANIYFYYISRGFIPIVLSNIVHLFTLAFVVFFSLFLMTCIDFSVPTIDITLITHISHPVLIIYLILFGVFFSWNVYHSFRQIFNARVTMRIYRDVLKIQDSQLEDLDWNMIVNTLVEHRDEFYCNELNAHIIANHLMRQTNYILAFHEKNLFNLLNINGSLFLTKSIEWTIQNYILSSLFTNGHVNEQILDKRFTDQTIKMLKTKVLIGGILNLVFLPFVLFFQVMYMFFKYSQEFQQNPMLIGQRQWTILAQWTFREYNEFDHIFEMRLNKSYKSSTDYINSFHNKSLVILSKFICFVTGAFLSVLTVFTLLIHSIDQNLLWFIGMFTLVFTAFNSVIPDPHVNYNRKRLLDTITEHTHYRDMKQKMFTFFDYKVKLLFQDIIGVFFIPFYLLYNVRVAIPDIVKFMQDFSIKQEHVGHVCSFASFNFERDSVPNIKLEQSIHNFKSMWGTQSI